MGAMTAKRDTSRGAAKSFMRPPNPYATLRAKTVPDRRKQESRDACRGRAATGDSDDRDRHDDDDRSEYGPRDRDRS